MQGAIDSYFSPSGSKKRDRSTVSPEVNSKPGKKRVDIPTIKMDEQKFKVLLDGLENRIMENFNKKLSTLATKEDVSGLTETVQVLSVENEEIKSNLQSLTLCNKILTKRLINLEDRNRRNNLIFKGLQFEPNETNFVLVVRRFCMNYLRCHENLFINRAHLLGNPKKNSSLIIAHFPCDDDVNFILSNVKKLKGTNYFVSKDFSYETRKKRGKLMALRKIIMSKKPGSKVRVVHDRLIIGEVSFTWDDDSGWLQFGNLNGEEKFNELLGNESEEILKTFKEGHRNNKHQRLDDVV